MSKIENSPIYFIQSSLTVCNTGALRNVTDPGRDPLPLNPLLGGQREAQTFLATSDVAEDDEEAGTQARFEQWRGANDGQRHTAVLKTGGNPFFGFSGSNERGRKACSARRSSARKWNTPGGGRASAPLPWITRFMVEKELVRTVIIQFGEDLLFDLGETAFYEERWREI